MTSYETIRVPREPALVYQGLSTDDANTQLWVNRFAADGYAVQVHRSMLVHDEYGATGRSMSTLAAGLSDQAAAALAARILEDIAIVDPALYRETLATIMARVDAADQHKRLAEHHAEQAGFRIAWPDNRPESE